MLGCFLTILIAAGSALYDDPFADRLIRSATDATYHLRLDEARAAARELQQRYPDHPAGYLIMAETYWWNAQADPGNSKIEEAYYKAEKMAERKAEAAGKSGKYYKPEILAYLASAHGSYARFQVTQKEAFFSAMRAGLRAHKYAEQVYALDNEYYDIYVGLGAFNYFSGTLPGVIKPFAWLLGAKGNKDLGVEQLETAMDKARYSRTEARIVYYTALLSNKEYSAAFTILERLMTDYSDNFVLYSWVTEWFRDQRRNLDGAEYFERVYSDQLSRSHTMAMHALLEQANLFIAENHKADALKTLDRVKQMPGSGDAFISTRLAALERQARKK